MAQQPEQSEEFFPETTAPQASQEVERWRQDPDYPPPFRIIRWRGTGKAPSMRLSWLKWRNNTILAQRKGWEASMRWTRPCVRS